MWGYDGVEPRRGSGFNEDVEWQGSLLSNVKTALTPHGHGVTPADVVGMKPRRTVERFHSLVTPHCDGEAGLCGEGVWTGRLTAARLHSFKEGKPKT